MKDVHCCLVQCPQVSRGRMGWLQSSKSRASSAWPHRLARKRQRQFLKKNLRENFLKARALKAFHTQTKVVDCVGNCVDLQILPIIFAGEIKRPCQVSATSERLIHALSVNLQAWNLIHRHALSRKTKESGERKKRKSILLFIFIRKKLSVWIYEIFPSAFSSTIFSSPQLYVANLQQTSRENVNDQNIRNQIIDKNSFLVTKSTCKLKLLVVDSLKTLTKEFRWALF